MCIICIKYTFVQLVQMMRNSSDLNSTTYFGILCPLPCPVSVLGPTKCALNLIQRSNFYYNLYINIIYFIHCIYSQADQTRYTLHSLCPTSQLASSITTNSLWTMNAANYAVAAAAAAAAWPQESIVGRNKDRSLLVVVVCDSIDWRMRGT